MSSEDEDMECEPAEVLVKTNLRHRTHTKYMHTNQQFHRWNKLNGNRPISEDVLLDYFANIATRSKPSTLFAVYSMLKATFRANDGIDIRTYSRLLDFLKEKNTGYKPAKSKVFNDDEIYKFLNEAPDYSWLDVKVYCAFAINGAFRKLINITTEHVKRYDDLFLVTIPRTDTIPQGTFTITGPFVSIVQKYVDLRPENALSNRFFLNYHYEKCTVQPIGNNQFNGMARRMATFLKLPEPERYSGYSFSRSAGFSFNTNLWNDGAEEQRAERIQLDDQTRHQKPSSFCYTRPPICTRAVAGRTIMDSNETEHICSFNCGQVQCALEENEKSVLHAFDVMKPPEYTITDVTPAVYHSQPTCRWIVAYTHNADGINAFTADEKFEDITRSIPYNVRINQRYIRGTTSQISGAYVVVYSVNCRCHKETEVDVFNFTVNEVKYEV